VASTDESKRHCVGKNVVYVATESCIGTIRYEPFTLLKKASYLERQLDE